MNLLFVVDGRSPIALNWIRYFVEGGHEVHLVSTYPCQPELNLASLTIIPAAFGDVAGGERAQGSGGSRGLLRKVLPVRLRTALRQWLGPLTLARAAKKLRVLIDEVQPELIHAMRIPFEGMLLAQATLIRGKVAPPPTVVSVWGNDFTLHAPANPQMGFLTRLTLQNITALHTDCQRDLTLARSWGWVPSVEPVETGSRLRTLFAAQPAGVTDTEIQRKGEIVLPGNGGIDMQVFQSPNRPIAQLPNRQTRVINPRGIRAYVRNDTFFAAIPLVLAKRPEVRFACPNMAGEALAEKWVKQYNIAQAVELLPRLTRSQMAEQFQAADVVTSITEHDGTPNTLLEAMACGCYPVVGDIESLREWITPGQNGSLVPPRDAAALATAILQAVDAPDLRQTAAEYNIQIVRARAEYQHCMAEAEQFYRKLSKNQPMSE
jgi:hypothetical protein